MGILAIVAAAVIGSTEAIVPRMCILESMPFLRTQDVPYVTLRATPDTMLDGRYYYYIGSGDGVSTTPSDHGEGQLVYGQVFEVLSTHADTHSTLSGHQRVVIVWWSLGPVCERSFPRESRGVLAGEDVFLAGAPRDPSDWINGLPTFDSDDVERIYHPSLPRGHEEEVVRPMTVHEYADVYALLPVEGGALSGMAVLDRLLDWGRDDPSRWTLWPARSFLCTAEYRASSGSANLPSFHGCFDSPK